MRPRRPRQVQVHFSRRVTDLVVDVEERPRARVDHHEREPVDVVVPRFFFKDVLRVLV